MATITTRVLSAAEAGDALEALAAVLVSCVEGGASVNFMLPYSHEQAVGFWHKVIASVSEGHTVLVAAYLDGKLAGTGQLGLDTPPNQPHRADVKKMLVHAHARGRGVGAAVMAQLDAGARARGITLLTLDTAAAEAERLYERAGFKRAGVIPGYALLPQGGLCDSVFYYKELV